MTNYFSKKSAENQQITKENKKKKKKEKPPNKNRGYWLKLTEKKKEQDRIKCDQKSVTAKSEVSEQTYCTDIVTQETSTLVHSDNLNLPEYSTQTNVGKIKIESEMKEKLNYSWESTQIGDLETKQKD